MEKIFDIHKVWAYTIMSVVSFLEPLWVLILWFFIFIACDFITGISASIKERQLITSNKMSRSIKKLLMYSITIKVLFYFMNEIISYYIN